MRCQNDRLGAAGGASGTRTWAVPTIGVRSDGPAPRHHALVSCNSNRFPAAPKLHKIHAFVVFGIPDTSSRCRWPQWVSSTPGPNGGSLDADACASQPSKVRSQTVRHHPSISARFNGRHIIGHRGPMAVTSPAGDKHSAQSSPPDRVQRPHFPPCWQ